MVIDVIDNRGAPHHSVCDADDDTDAEDAVGADAPG
jgi:hypothetical protein